MLNACRRHGSFHGFAGVAPPVELVVLNACRRHGSFHRNPSWMLSERRACSTPVGVMDRFTSVVNNMMTKSPHVLNACRRHGSFHSKIMAMQGPRCPVLNACRRHGSFHCQPPENSQPGLCVLNACRRHGSFHRGTCATSLPRGRAQRLSASWIVSPVQGIGHGQVRLCSTPVGVMDRFTCSMCRSASGRKRAQRLSASWIVSPVQHRVTHPFVRVLNACRRHRSFHTGVGTPIATPPSSCSTPVGVMDRFTNYRRPYVTDPLGVLNACRRHRSFHINPNVVVHLDLPVLNACRRHGSFHWLMGLPCFYVDEVLNACRRHGSFHHFRFVPSSAALRVLNACRRHGSVHAGSSATTSA